MLDFDKAVLVGMQSEVGPWFREDYPACISGIVKTRQDRVQTGDVDHPNDPGGHTRFGIAQRHNPEVNISTLTYPEAKKIYYKKYWVVGDCDHLPSLLNIIHFDAVINHGVRNSSKFIQRALGFLGNNVDGDIGPYTLGAIAKVCKDEQSTKEFCMKVLDQRERFFRVIASRNSKLMVFLKGWLNRVLFMRQQVSKF